MRERFVLGVKMSDRWTSAYRGPGGPRESSNSHGVVCFNADRYPRYPLYEQKRSVPPAGAAGFSPATIAMRAFQR